jgi:hypothetical protein
MQMRYPAICSTTLMALAMAGCSQPAVAPKAPAFQESAVTVRDWDTAAQHIAAELTAHGFLPDPLNPQSLPVPAQRYPLFVQVIAPDSTFLREMREALQSEILRRGGILSRSPASAMVVNLDVDVIRWGARDRNPGGFATAAGLATGTGILLANAAPLTPAAGFGIAVGAGLAADVLLSLTPSTDTEAVWEASILSQDQVLLDVRAPLYIPASDSRLYWSRTRLSPTVSLKPPTTTYAKNLHYVP